MPTYEYECGKCRHVFEIFQGINDDALTDCPECSGELRRVIHGGAGLVFKGSGFYITDSRGSATGGRKGSQEKESTPPCKNADKSCAESCPAAKN